MAMIQCPECGKDISDNAVSCPSCGYQLINTNTQYKKIIPGRGFGISSMVMGILGALYGFLALSSANAMPEYTKADAIAGTVLPIIFAVLALVFGFVSNSKGYNKGQKKAGIVLGVVSLVLCIIAIISA